MSIARLYSYAFSMSYGPVLPIMDVHLYTLLVITLFSKCVRNLKCEKFTMTSLMIQPGLVVECLSGKVFHASIFSYSFGTKMLENYPNNTYWIYG